MREWWIIETKSSYFIYEDEITANKELESQAAAYGWAEIHHTKSDYDALKIAYEERGMVMRESGDMVRSLYQPQVTALKAEVERLKSHLGLLQKCCDQHDLQVSKKAQWQEQASKLAEALEFECGNRCAEQNPCNAKQALAEFDKFKEGMK